jgi:O-methyltransferase
MRLPTSIDDAVQRQWAAAHDQVTLADCYIYHWFDMPSGETLVGSWDLRENWRAYLGGVDFRGKRVLETGPASGYLSLKMEAMGAEVVAFDLPPGTPPDLLPVPGLDDAMLAVAWAKAIDRVRNSWWFFHRAFASKNKAVYGNIYDIPKDIGRFDATFMGAILLHLSNPFEAIRQVASITDEMIVVTDLNYPDFKQRPYMEFSPNPKSRDPLSWWIISPFAIARMLTAVGFPHVEFNYHSHRAHASLEADNGVMHEFYSVVGRRNSS